MAHFLRDVQLSDIKITEDVILELADAFTDRSRALIDSAHGNKDKEAIFFFTLRFDGKGYRLFSLDQLLPHFRNAKDVERVIITIETGESISSERRMGEHLEIRFDKLEEKNCWLTVTSDDSSWVDASYALTQEVINKHRTKTGWMRSGVFTLIIQLLGVIAGFALSLWAALKISPFLSIQYPFVITFIFAFLLFSNIWGYINTAILARVRLIFPSIQFYRPDKDRLNWLKQASIFFIISSIVVLLFRIIYTNIGNFVSEILK